jgi:ABC-type polysaccharide/polyol phosphate transport system ATPase subunit
MADSTERLPALEMVGVGKRYRIAERSLLHTLRPSRRRAAREIWAVKDIDLRIEQGETVGLLGHNGAGKSTLLRILAGVSEPTSGVVTVRGRVAPLISVGVGFHQELTGRENVYVNGMLLGLTKDEVEERFDDIVAFAELGDRIDSPVKFYSSGMFMRLGFSVAIHVDPEVLLVDEVLAVGDVAFQLKCFDRMRELSAGGTTIVLVSHSMHAIGLLCPRAVLFRQGNLVFDGPSEAAIEQHHRLLATEGERDTRATTDQLATGEVEVDADLFAGDQPTAHADQDTDLRLVAKLRFLTPQDSPQIIFRVLSEDGQVAYEYHSPIGSDHRVFAAGEETTAEVSFRPALGGGGTFRLLLIVADRSGRQALGRTEPALHLYVPPRFGVAGLADLQSEVLLGGTKLVHQPLTLGPRAEAG